MKIRLAALLLPIALLAACNPTPPAQPSAPTHTLAPSATATSPATARPTITRAPTLSPTVTKELFELEILDSEVYQDQFGNTRVTVTVRNPYDFALETEFRPRASLYDQDGNVLRSQQLLEDGVYGPISFQPGSTHTLVGCFDPCDGGVPVGDWKTYTFIFILQRVE